MSMTEILVIVFVAFLVIKPEQLPEVAFALGRAIQWFRSSVGKVKGEMNSFIESIEGRNDRKRD